MTRTEEREEAFKIVFENIFNGESVDEIIENATDSRDLEIAKDSFAYKLAKETIDHISEIDSVISQYSTHWKPDRIAKTALAILRIAVCEIEYFEDIPESVSVNEAVELSKTYCGDDDPAFVNGVLGAVIRKGNKKES